MAGNGKPVTLVKIVIVKKDGRRAAYPIGIEHAVHHDEPGCDADEADEHVDFEKDSHDPATLRNPRSARQEIARPARRNNPKHFNCLFG